MPQTLIIFLALLFLGCSSNSVQVPGKSQRQPAADSARLAQAQSLNEVNKGEYLGLDFESSEFQNAMTKKAETFIHFRAGHISSSERTAFLNDCKPFCAFTEKFKPPRDPDKDDDGTVMRGAKQVRKMKAAFLKGEVSVVEKLNDSSIRNLLKRMSKFVHIELASNTVLKAQGCSMSRLSYFLAGKTEEFFPDEKVRARALELYEKASSCNDDDLGMGAAYRASLLHLWANDCKGAMPLFSKLIADKNSRIYRSRALYWQYHCAQELNKLDVATLATKTLLTDHPFSLHTLLVQKEISDQLKTFAARPDSDIRFRSELNPKVNDALVAAETLIRLKQMSLASDVLNTGALEFEKTEPSLQLYVALLFNRAGNYVGKFKLLAPLFRDRPEMISKSSLALYYPRRDLNEGALQAVGLDEFLVLALVRQESAFNERAKSRAGAMGLMQIMPRTARGIERIATKKLFDPDINVRIGGKFFAKLLTRFNGDTELALAAYNAGPLNVDDWVERYPIPNRILFLDLIPFRETREYVTSIARNYYWYSVLYTDAPGSPEAATAAAAAATDTTEKAGTKQAPLLSGVFKLFGS